MSERAGPLPIAPEEFQMFVTDLGLPDDWALAVSGGPDSTALMLLAARWAVGQGHPAPIVVTVDHGLRSDSKSEAAQVAAWAGALGLRHETLVWHGPKPNSNIQAVARHARYGLIGQFCANHGITAVLTGHTLNDQAETVLQRLGRGSGVDGLAAMARDGHLPVAQPDLRHIRLVRPLLGVLRERVMATLKAFDHPWIEDPSNQDMQYGRVRMRRALALLAPEGITVERLAQTAVHMARARSALTRATDALCAQAAVFHDAGYVRVDGAALFTASDELALRALSRLLMTIGGAAFPPRYDRLVRLFDAMQADRSDHTRFGRGRTLAGCRILSPDCHGRFLIVRELRALNQRLAERDQTVQIGFGQTVTWDNRFQLTLAPDQRGRNPDWNGDVRPLGRAGWRQINQTLGPDRLSHAVPHGFPHEVRATLPALWVGDELAAAAPFGIIKNALFPGDLAAPARFDVKFIGAPGGCLVNRKDANAGLEQS